MRKYALVMILCLAGCAPNFDSTLPLNQQLAGRLPQEQHEILRLDCLNGAEKITPFVRISLPRGAYRYEASSQMRAMKNLCEDMSDLPAGDGKRAQDLADECGQELTLASQRRPSHIRQSDIVKMEQVCKRMTGMPINNSP